MAKAQPSDDSDNQPSDSSEDQGEDALLSLARERFHLAQEAWTQIRKEALDDVKFAAGEQWPEDIKRSRDLDRRPCLTINRLPQFIRQVTNDQRQNRPSIKVNPVDDQGTIETAKIFQGMIRHIEYNSGAEIAYDSAFEGMCMKGFSFFRILSDYMDSQSFDQELLVKRIPNDFAVYPDPGFKEPDGSDMEWCFIHEDLTKKDFKRKYPDSELASLEDWQSIGDKAEDWVTKDSVRIAEYFYKEYQDATLLLLKNTKQTVIKEKLDDKGLAALEDNIVNERKTKIPVVKWCKINGIEVLEETEWAGTWIPVIPVLGNEIYVDGNRVFESLIRYAKDSQRMYNFWASAETESIALAPKAPFVMAEGQMEGHEAEWKTANTKSHAALQYKPVTIAGQPAPPPQRQNAEPAIQAITGARMQSADDLKATTGIYDASLGNRSNEQSGVAIQRRNSQSQVSNFHFMDNMNRSMRHAGRILLEMIPVVYDAPRAIRCIAEDDSQEIVLINQIFQKGGKTQKHELGVGRYDCTVSTGPSYQTRRQEAVSSMMDFIRFNPQSAQVVSDLMVRNMDWPGAQEIADRLKKLLPPGIAETDKDKQHPIPPQIQQQMMQMNQMIQQLTQELNASQELIRTGKLELESKERIALINAETQLKMALLKTGSSDAQTAFKLEMEEIQHRREMLNDAQPIDANFQPAGGQPAAPMNPQQQPSTGGASPG